MPETAGPAQILAVGFREGARFEGRIAEQIELLETSNTIRVLDFAFLHATSRPGRWCAWTTTARIATVA